MAWRIDEAVVRGVIDNRVRDRVTGRIWFAGRAAPVELDLAGNCWRDLAGRRLEFTNPDPKPGELRGIGARQTGLVGDITASRKVKVPDIPLSQIGEYYAAKKKWPWHWGNSLYLEWFSDRNGRVVIESAAFRLTISPGSAWDMTPAAEQVQRGANTEVMGGFMTRLGEAVAADRAAKGELTDDTPPEWNEEPEILAEDDEMAPSPREGASPGDEPHTDDGAEADAILDLLVRLERLRRAVEREFPRVRAFKRPGFD